MVHSLLIFIFKTDGICLWFWRQYQNAEFGDGWHRLRVQSIRTGGFTKKSIKVIKSVGKSPEQYPDYDDYENEDYD
jgi:hypothetical protein